MNAIVVTDKQWAIGRSGDLLFSLPGDMKHFRTLTTGGTVIMGRKTLDSFPGGKPLPKRRNIVITRSPDFHREGCETVSTPEDALALAGDEENVWLIGGGSPKNFMLQTEPQIQEVLMIPEVGQDYDINVTDARPDTGGLSGAPPTK